MGKCQVCGEKRKDGFRFLTKEKSKLLQFLKFRAHRKNNPTMICTKCCRSLFHQARNSFQAVKIVQKLHVRQKIDFLPAPESKVAEPSLNSKLAKCQVLLTKLMQCDSCSFYTHNIIDHTAHTQAHLAPNPAATPENSTAIVTAALPCNAVSQSTCPDIHNPAQRHMDSLPAVSPVQEAQIHGLPIVGSMPELTFVVIKTEPSDDIPDLPEAMEPDQPEQSAELPSTPKPSEKNPSDIPDRVGQQNQVELQDFLQDCLTQLNGKSNVDAEVVIKTEPSDDIPDLPEAMEPDQPEQSADLGTIDMQNDMFDLTHMPDVKMEPELSEAATNPVADHEFAFTNLCKVKMEVDDASEGIAAESIRLEQDEQNQSSAKEIQTAFTNLCKVKMEVDDASEGIAAESIRLEQDEQNQSSAKEIQTEKKTCLRQLKLECDLCGLCLVNKNIMEWHIKISHCFNPVVKVVKSKRFFFQCMLCETEVFSRHDFLLHHMSKLHPHMPKPFQCLDCDKQFYCPARLKSHIHRKNIAKTKPVVPTKKCEVCSLDFFCKSQLKYHVFEAHSKTRFQCGQCFVAFFSMFSLEAHCHQLHPSGTPKVCDICKSKDFVIIDVLYQDIVYMCVVCSGLKFSDTWLSPSELAKTCISSFKPFLCHTCFASFHLKKHLRHHIQWLHMGRGFICNHCQYRTRRKSKLVHHIKYSHFFLV